MITPNNGIPLEDVAETPNARAKILLLLHLPPPVHGSTVVGCMVRDCAYLTEHFECDFISITTGGQVGGFGVSWVIRYLHVMGRVISALFRKRYALIYVTPSVSGLSFIKDGAIIFLARLTKSRIVLHLHNRGLKSNRWVPEGIKRYVLRNTAVILLTERQYDDVSDYCPQSAVFILPLGCQTRSVERQSTDSRVAILFLSNLIRSKGIFLLLEACAVLKSRGYEFICRVAGKPIDVSVSDFDATVKRMGLTQHVQYIGPVYGVDKTAALGAADVFVFPSMYPQETFGLVVLEAMSFGLSIVATDIGGVPEMLNGGSAGIVIPQNDAEALAEALGRFCDDPLLRRRMSAEALARQRAMYTTETFNERVLQIFRALIHR